MLLAVQRKNDAAACANPAKHHIKAKNTSTREKIRKIKLSNRMWGKLSSGFLYWKVLRGATSLIGVGM